MDLTKYLIENEGTYSHRIEEKFRQIQRKILVEDKTYLKLDSTSWIKN